MQHLISETYFQKSFLAYVHSQSRPFYKANFKDFNTNSNLDHSVTNTLFNLLNKEITVIKEMVPTLDQVYQTLQLETKNQKKKLLSKDNANILARLSDSPFIIEYKFHSSLKNYENELKFIISKFTISLNRLYVFAGLYEELYLLNAMYLHVNGDAILSYKNNIFSLTKNSTTLTFQVFPIFFFSKYLLNDQFTNYFIRTVLEYVLKNNFLSSNYLLTIADDEQIKNFNAYCTMTYLSEFAFRKVLNGESIRIPSIHNLSKLPW